MWVYVSIWILFIFAYFYIFLKISNANPSSKTSSSLNTITQTIISTISSKFYENFRSFPRFLESTPTFSRVFNCIWFRSVIAIQFAIGSAQNIRSSCRDLFFEKKVQLKMTLNKLQLQTPNERSRFIIDIQSAKKSRKTELISISI
jgi:hypothetical protein